MKYNLLKIYTLLLVFTPSYSQASDPGFSIDQEFKVRQLKDKFTKRYGMKIKIKRDNGSLAVNILDSGFYVQDWRITKGGADLVKQISAALCISEKDCEVELKTHHSLPGETARDQLKKTQYKMSSVSLQLLQTKISPKHLTQVSLGGSDPLIKVMPDDPVSADNANELNTRTEITFTPKRGKL